MVNNDKNLTVPAESALDEYLAGIRKDIITLAQENNLRRDSYQDEITAQEISDAIRRRESSKGAGTNRHKARKQALQTISVLGAVYILMGVLITLYNFTSDGKLINEYLGVLLSMLGIIVSLVAALYSRKLDQGAKQDILSGSSASVTDQQAGLLANAVKVWVSLENGLLKNVSEKDRRSPIRRMIADAHNDNIISDEELEKILRFLSLRNSLVHTGSSDIDIQEAFKLMRDTESIARKLDS